MYYIVVKTKYNEIKMLLEDFYDESFQQLIRQPYVCGVYLQCVDEKDIENNPQYANVYKVKRKDNDVSCRNKIR